MAMIVTFVIGLLLLIVGLTMLLGAAFRRRMAWGLAIILLPFMYPLYAVFNWSTAGVRNGFLISVAGFLILLVAMYGGVLRELPFNEAQEIAAKMPIALPPDGPLPNDTAANAVVLPAGQKFDALVDERFGPPALPLSPKSDRPVTPARTHEFRFYEVRREHVLPHLGKTLKIVKRGGKVEQGILVGSGIHSLLLEVPLPGGSAAFEYPLRDLVAVYIYDHQPSNAVAEDAEWGDVPAMSGDAANVPDQQAADAPAGSGRLISEPVTNELEVENELPNALSDLPVWAVPEDNLWRPDAPHREQGSSSSHSNAGAGPGTQR